jgi:hypothetical protein
MTIIQNGRMTINLPASLRGCLELAVAKQGITPLEACHRIIDGLDGLIEADVRSLTKPPWARSYDGLEIEMDREHFDRLTQATMNWQLSNSEIFQKILYALLITRRVRFAPKNENLEFRLELSQLRFDFAEDCKDEGAIPQLSKQRAGQL